MQLLTARNQFTKISLSLLEPSLPTQTLDNHDIGNMSLIAPHANLPLNFIKRVKIVILNEGIQENMVTVAIQVQTLKVHIAEHLEGNRRFAGNCVTDYEGVIETNTVVDLRILVTVTAADDVVDEVAEVLEDNGRVLGA
jgi:hypothetical protein